MGFVVLVLQGHHIGSDPGEEYSLDEDIEAKKGHDVTGSWDEASLYASWTGVSSGIGLFHDVVVALAVKCLSVSGFVFHGHLLMDSGVGTL
jgi:hypothetical protein